MGVSRPRSPSRPPFDLPQESAASMKRERRPTPACCCSPSRPVSQSPSAPCPLLARRYCRRCMCTRWMLYTVDAVHAARIRAGWPWPWPTAAHKGSPALSPALLPPPLPPLPPPLPTPRPLHVGSQPGLVGALYGRAVQHNPYTRRSPVYGTEANTSARLLPLPLPLPLLRKPSFCVVRAIALSSIVLLVPVAYAMPLPLPPRLPPSRSSAGR